MIPAYVVPVAYDVVESRAGRFAYHRVVGPEPVCTRRHHVLVEPGGAAMSAPIVQPAREACHYCGTRLDAPVEFACGCVGRRGVWRRE